MATKGMLHNPSEFFGFPPTNKSDIANKIRREYRCPFLDIICTKQSRLLHYPLGVCSVWHQSSPHIVCPQRFYFEGHELVKDIAKLFLKKKTVCLVPEVRLAGFGNVDWVAFTQGDNGAVQDFCGIETVANDTTQTGQLVRAIEDFLKKGRLRRRYNFGLNTYNAVKLSFTQIMNKGQVFESWKKRYIWILQDTLFANMLERFGLELKEGLRKHYIVFVTVKLHHNKNTDLYEVQQDKIYCTSIRQLAKAYKRESLLPIDDFVKAIERRAQQGILS